MIRFDCACGRQLQAREEDAGKKARCPSCKEVMSVPAAAEEDEPPRRERERPEAVSEERSPRTRPRLRDDAYEDEDDSRDRRRRRGRDTEAKTSGLATWSLVLGCCGFCLSFLTAVPAILLAILALNAIGKSNGRLGGKGLAIAGLATGCVALIFQAGLIALLVPAVSKVREAAARMQDSNNMKQIGLAMHNFHDVHGGLPQAAAYYTKDGKPGLSWRVALLPYIEQENLFRQFKLDEPWDSPHNLALLPRMPKVYLVPGKPDDGSGMTHYQVFVGEKSLFEVPKKGARGEPAAGQPRIGWRMAEVTDGLSNTILVVEATAAVAWTKPDDLPFVPGGALPPLGGQRASGYNVLLGDGSVWPMRGAIPPQTLDAMITRNGGEAVNRPQPGGRAGGWD